MRDAKRGNEARASRMEQVVQEKIGEKFESPNVIATVDSNGKAAKLVSCEHREQVTLGVKVVEATDVRIGKTDRLVSCGQREQVTLGVKVGEEAVVTNGK